MRSIPLLLGSIATSALLGFLLNPKQAKADLPAACPRFQCKTVHAYWDPLERTQYVAAHHQVNLSDNTNALYPNIFTPTSTEKDGAVRNGNYDLWIWDSCNPMCGKSVPVGGGAATWQSPQEVARAGNGAKLIAYANSHRYTCSPADGGNGPQSSDQTNPNSDAHVPPGVSGDQPPAGGD